jgi:hypothetical protein
LVYDPRSKGAESYIRLAKEIIERQALGTGLRTSDLGPQPVAVSDQPVAGEIPATGDREGHGGENDAAVEEIPPAEEMDKTA